MRSVASAFADAAARTPDAVAVEDGARRLTYAELAGAAAALAARLGLVGEARVALVGGRSVEMVVGVVGTALAGGASVCIDPATPEARRRTVIADADARVVLTPADVDLGVRAPLPAADTGPGHLLYVNYTSGSTGRPKGVAVEHRGILRLTSTGPDFMPAAGEALLAASSVEFDGWAWEVWGTLLNGARLVLHPPGRPDPRAIGAALERHTIAVLGPATGFFHQLVDGCLEQMGGLRLVSTGGDVLSPAHAARFLAAHPHCRLINCYGPTEATVNATSFHVTAAEPGRPVPIGGAEPGVRAYVLDDEGQPAQEGELHIGGAGVARGYLNLPELTAAAFVPDPFADEPGARMYRTGDRVSRRGDGLLEFVGRRDDQVKIRGFRVEPGEVEAVLGEHPAVAHAAVVARRGPVGRHRLLAYAVPTARPAPGGLVAELDAYLAERLPEHLRPAALTLLDALPVTPLGKLDRDALPEPQAGGAPARGEREARLLDVWREVLQLPAAGRDDDFFVLGGDSLLAVRLAGAVRAALGADVTIGDIFAARTPAALAERLRPATGGLPPLRPGPGEREAPVSFAQAQVCFQLALAPGSLAYQFPAVIRLDGALDAAALERALRALVARHEVFRTTFPQRDGVWRQRIEAPPEVRLPVEDVADEAALWARADALFREPLPMDRVPLVRWTLLRIDGERHALVHHEHHLSHDGWSFMLVLGELAALYAAETGAAPAPPAPALQYADFARWQRALPETDEGRRQLAHWTQRLADAPPMPDLPADRPRPTAPSGRGDQVTIALDRGLAGELRALALARGATVFTAMLAAFAALLHERTGATDLVIGSGLANRRLPETHGLIGMLVNTVALRIDAAGDPSAGELLDRVLATVLDAQEHQELPFEAVVQAVAPRRAAGRSPLYQTLFSFHDTPLPDLEAGGLRITPDETRPNGSAKADVNVVVVHRGGELEVLWEYSTDLFDRATAEAMAADYVDLLRSFAARPGAAISAHTGRAPAAEPGYERDGTIAGVFAERVGEAPGATALEWDGGAMTYAELDAAADALARRLVLVGVAPGSRVGVCLERSAAMIVAVLAALKARAAYVPLDPGWPGPRLAALCDEAGVAAVVTDLRLAARLPARIPVLAASPEGAGDSAPLPAGPEGAGDSAPLPAGPEGAGDSAPLPAGGPEDPAYVMFTSGSTGEPKGVEVGQRAVLRLVRAADYVRLDREQVLLGLAPLSFDASTLEIWGALLNGGRLALAPAGTLSAAEIAEAIARHGVTTLWLTAGLFAAFVDLEPAALRRVRQLLAGGDVLSPDHVERALALLPPDGVLVNGYGPTENTTFTCVHIMRPGETVARPVPIGRPVPHTSVHVLDAAGEPVAPGADGELWIGGDGLARGYLGAPDLTAQRFVEHPRLGRLYRSGDRVRLRPGGALDFLGRADRQVKVRGFRIEPAEVEAELVRHPAVREVAVVTRGRTAEERRLVAYLTGADLPADPAAALRAFLAERVPRHLVPSAFVRLDHLPLTPNGKVDRDALPEPASGGDRPGVSATNGDAAEEAVAAVFAEVLGVPVGPGDDFFELGGHSLLAVQLFARIEARTGARLPLATIFAAPTVAGVADAVKRARAVTAVPRTASLIELGAAGDRPPFFAITAGDGNAVGFGALARRLAGRQPFYALQPRGLDGRAPLLHTVEAMARAYEQEIRAVAPHGPYLVGGRCLGGVVAFELARRLTRADEVALVAVFDSLGPHWRPRPLTTAVAYDEVVNLCRLRARAAGLAFAALREEADAEALAAWIAEPADGAAPPLNRYLHEAYRARPDVQAAFPDAAGADAIRIVDWAWITGQKEMGLQPGLLPRPTGAAEKYVPPRTGRAARMAAWAGAAVPDALDVALRGRSRRLAVRRDERLAAIARAAAARYRAGAYDGAITLLRTVQYEGNVEIARWHGVEGAAVRELPILGSHRSMLREPDVGSLAAALDGAIEQALQPSASRTVSAPSGPAVASAAR